MIIHWVNDMGKKINFGTFYRNGKFDTSYICYFAKEAGDISIGEDYLKEIAALIGGTVRKKDENNLWTWRVEKNGQVPRIRDLLEVKDELLTLITNTIEKFMTVNAS